ncbi:protein disulfide-isomerase, partial [Clonorchis sinensis]
MNRPRKGDTAGTRTAAHEMDGGHVNHYATAPTFSLPKIEIDMFSGNPMEFCKFIKAFQMSIADRLFDDSNKLMYLLYYCRGEAKDAIEHCVFLPGKAGYQRAMDILRTQFGRPHDIAQSFMNELLVGGPIAPGDVDALRRLIRKMVNCDLALKQMHYTADLNCSTNLKRIVERLPRHLQQRWAEAADDILRSGSEPEFDHLVSFLDRSVSIASNCYGVIASPRRYGNQVDKVVLERPPRKARINVVATKASMACPHCSQTHSLSECEVFRTLSQVEKLSRLKGLKLCFNCLEPNHRAFECRVPTRCDISNCNQRHHRLLHSRQRVVNEATKGANVNSTVVEGPRSYLGFVAVKLIGPKGTVLTHALLDNGSDTTLLTADVAKQLGIEGEATRVEVSSVNGPDIKDTMAVSFAIQSLHDGYV